jgi:membrane protease subunit HflK
MRFGKYHSTQQPGLHFKVPLVDRAVLVDVSERGMRLPVDEYSEDNPPPGRISSYSRARTQQELQDSKLILTGDLYAGVVEWNVIWRVTEPKDYLFSIEKDHVAYVITAVARSAMHATVGDYSADEILTSKREEIGLVSLKQMQQAMDQYNCGVEIIDWQMQRVVPPDRVRAAFDEVNASIQQRDQSVNEAKQERNKLIPQAEASADKLVREAEGYAARRRAEATGEISALLAKYRAYKAAPEVTRQRLYLEAMEGVIEKSGPKTVLDEDLKSLLPLLNLEEGSND